MRGGNARRQCAAMRGGQAMRGGNARRRRVNSVA